jgi:hypothetical protein
MSVEFAILVISAVSALQSYLICAILVLQKKNLNAANKTLALMLFFLTNGVVAHLLITLPASIHNPGSSSFVVKNSESPLIVSFLVAANLTIFSPLLLRYTGSVPSSGVKASSGD